MTDVTAAVLLASQGPSELSIVVTQLLKGVVYRDVHEKQWVHLCALRNQVSDYLSVIGLMVEVDEAEGYAFLRNREAEDESQQIPRLVARRPLSFQVSLLLALLRKRLAEHDASSAQPRLVLSREQIVELLRMFAADSSNEARLVDQIDTSIIKVLELGFLRRLQGEQNLFEVRRIIKAYVDGQWLSEFDARLQEYRDQLSGSDDEEAGR